MEVESDVEKPACCAKKDAAPDSGSREGEEAPDHKCACVKTKDTLVSVVLAIPERTSEGIDVDFPIAFEDPSQGWVVSRVESAPYLDLPPPPPIRQLFCVLRL